MSCPVGDYAAVWSQSYRHPLLGKGVCRGVESVSVGIGQAVGADIPQGIDIGELVAGHEVDETGGGVAAYAVAVVADVHVQRQVGAPGLCHPGGCVPIRG